MKNYAEDQVMQGQLREEDPKKKHVEDRTYEIYRD